MAKSAEKLIILGDVGKGLLARLYNLLPGRFRRPAALNEDVEKVTKTYAKRFPEQPNDIDRQQEELFRKRAQEIAAELKDYYLTVQDVMNFGEAAFSLFRDIGQNIREFKFELNADLMTMFMELFVTYLQLHLLLSRCDELKMMLSVYARAHHLTNGNTEGQFQRIAAYVNEFSDPLPALRLKCVELVVVGDTLLSFAPLVLKWDNLPQMLIQTRTLSVLEDAKEMGADKGIKEHLELLHLDRLHTWVLYGFLVCPAELAKQGAVPLLCTCIKDCFSLPIYRDEALDLEEAYKELFEDFKVNKFKLSAHKKEFKETLALATEALAKFRRLRIYLRMELNTLLHFFSEFPHLLGPKFQLLLAGMRLARSEVLRYFVNISQPGRLKKHERKEIEDSQISTLIFLLDRLNRLVVAHSDTVQKYATQRLRGAALQTFEPLVQTFVSQVKTSHGVSDLLNEVLSALRRASVDDDLEATRLNTYRILAALHAQQSGIPAKDAASISGALTQIILHTRNVDRVESQLRQHSSLMLLVWWRDGLSQLLQTTLLATEGQPAHCLAIISLLNAAMENVHRVCPEEQKTLSERCLHNVEVFFGYITTAVEKLLQGIFARTIMLREQGQPMAVIARARAAAEAQQVQPNGFESHYINQSTTTRELLLWRKMLGEICMAVREVDSLVVYNTEFYPREFLYEAIMRVLRATMRKLLVTEKTIQRPSIFLTQVRDVLYSLAAVDSHCNLNLGDLVRQVLYGEFVDASVGSAGEALGEERKEEAARAGTNSLQGLCQWYMALLQRDLSEMRVTYSELRRGFVTRMLKADRSAAMLAENYADLSELRALCVLMGPQGVRYFDRALLGVVSRHVAEVKAILKENEAELRTLQGRFTEQLVWQGQIDKIKGVDRLVKVSVVLGCTLKFRKLLHEALQQVQREQVPFIFESVRSMFVFRENHVALHRAITALQPLDNLAVDCGLDAGAADHALKKALRPLKQTPADDAALSLLPELFGCCFVSPWWRDAMYFIDTESHFNNANTLTAAIIAMIVGFNALPLDTRPVDDAEQRSRQDLERFVRCAAFTILHMNSSIPALRERFQAYNMPSIMVFIEQFVQDANRWLKLSVLEDFFPFTILRANYIQMYERQLVKGRSYAAVDEEKE